MTHIPLDHPAVMDAISKIPPQFQPYAWIAGSAACRYPEAWEAGGDLDTWLCVPNYHDWTLVSNHYTATIVEQHAGYMPGIKLLAEGRLHLMLETNEIEDVIDMFDISCHAAALPLLGGAVKYSYTYSENVRILHTRDPRYTLFRGIKFALRYHDVTFWTDPATRSCAASAMQYPEWVVSDGL